MVEVNFEERYEGRSGGLAGPKVVADEDIQPSIWVEGRALPQIGGCTPSPATRPRLARVANLWKAQARADNPCRPAGESSKAPTGKGATAQPGRRLRNPRSRESPAFGKTQARAAAPSRRLWRRPPAKAWPPS
ncbi:hypothetical protein NL676_004460 [Syzygium grande]|nr:hypothetical protein NL676_004460 [Syzygium grande]